MREPSASTTSSASTESRVTPYFAQRSPPALVATLPPMVEILKLAGSGAYISPCTAAAALRSALMTPGSTTAVSSSGLRSRMRFIRSRLSTTQPSLACAPPETPVPAPRATSGTPRAAQARTVAWTSATDSARTTACGSW